MDIINRHEYNPSKYCCFDIEISKYLQNTNFKCVGVVEPVYREPRSPATNCGWER